MNNFIYPDISNTYIELNANPHYSDRRFNKPRTIFCSEPENLYVDNLGYQMCKDCYYEYSDRLEEWYSNIYREAQQIAIDKGYAMYSQKYFETYLNELYEDEIELVHIMAGVNLSNGYPYQIFGIRRKTK